MSGRGQDEKVEKEDTLQPGSRKRGRATTREVANSSNHTTTTLPAKAIPRGKRPKPNPPADHLNTPSLRKKEAEWEEDHPPAGPSSVRKGATPKGAPRAGASKTPTLPKAQTEWEEEQPSAKPSTSVPLSSSSSRSGPSAAKRKQIEKEAAALALQMSSTERSPKRAKTIQHHSPTRSPPTQSPLTPSISRAAPKKKSADPFLASFFNPSAPTGTKARSPSPTAKKPDSKDHSLPDQSSLSQTTSIPSLQGGTFDYSEDEDEEWEEVGGIAEQTEESVADVDGSSFGQFDIVIPKADYKALETPQKKPKTRGIRKEDRIVRAELHKTHLLCLLSAGLFRNRWCDNPELQSTALSLIPDSITTRLTLRDQKGKGKATSSRSTSSNEIPNFRHYLKMLTHWWRDYFKTQRTAQPPPTIDGPRGVMKALGEFLEKPVGDVGRVVDPDSFGGYNG
ncbi:hypothetical protein HDV00_002125 [Rhizophlyctis rosea]|nr:hypothetical protein HDV00_002125 [Rhizophlyctis rosea]